MTYIVATVISGLVCLLQVSSIADGSGSQLPMQATVLDALEFGKFLTFFIRDDSVPTPTVGTTNTLQLMMTQRSKKVYPPSKQNNTSKDRQYNTIVDIIKISGGYWTNDSVASGAAFIQCLSDIVWVVSHLF